MSAGLTGNLAFIFLLIFQLSGVSASAATFTNLARVEISDSSGLSWNNDTKALTVSCWFRLIIPTDAGVTENMTILVNSPGSSESSHHSYLIQFNVGTGNVDFSARGNNGVFTNTFIQQPYLERWYHVAVVRQGEVFTGYVDGRQVFTGGGNVGAVNSGTVQIGGWGDARYLRGEVQEVAIYQGALSEPQIQDRMFKDQTGFQRLIGYYKLGFTTNQDLRYNNYAPGASNHGAPKGAGTISFEETDQAGEQSLFDARKNQGENALVPLSGAFSWEQTALGRPTPGIVMDFRFGYSSANTSPGAKIGSLDPYANPALGLGWRHTFETRLVPEPFVQEIRVVHWNGAIDTWFSTNGVFQTRHKEYRGELAQMSGAYEWTTPERIVYRFRDFQQGLIMSGRLSEIRDFNGNKVQVLWNENEGLITNAVDTTGGRFGFQYDSRNLLTNVNFQGWSANFAYDQTNRLASKSLTGPAAYATNNTAWQFFYNNTNGLMERIVDPRTNTVISVAYDKYGRKTNQVDALNRTNRTEYGVPGKRQLRQTDPANFLWIETYDRKGHILVQEDPLHNKTSYTYDDHGNRTSVTEPLGWKTTYGYDERANVIARTNALAEVSQWIFHPFFNKPIQEITPQPPDVNGWTTWTNFFNYDSHGNLFRHFDALGSLVSYTYNKTNGLVETSTDANGNVARFGYDTNGFLITRIDPATNKWSYGYNEVGWKLAETNAVFQITTNAFDVNGNVIQIVDPLPRTFTRTYDPNGNLLSASDGKGQFTRYAYDAANQKTNVIDRATNSWTYLYTSRGKLERAIDPLNNAITNTYDAANRLIAVSDPLGNSVTNIYDANGSLAVFIDKLGQRWIKTYDRLNRVLTAIDPPGNTTRMTYDVAGRIKEVFSPNGFPSSHTYDGRGRLVRWTDAERFTWAYQYDGVGNITNIIDALNGNYSMVYSNRNERILERNQDNFEWRYEYDALLRLSRQTDPNQTTRTVTYDPGGRLTNVVFSTGRVNSLAYDANDNPTNVTRISSGAQTPTRLEYDALDHVKKSTDVHALSVEYRFDALGNPTNVIYPNAKTLTRRFDALGRMTNQVDWDNREMNFAYDKGDRITRRTYPNGIIQTNLFDTAGRLTNLVYVSPNAQTSSLNLALTYAYDHNGNKIRSTEVGTLKWFRPPLATEKARYTKSGRLIDREITQTAPTNALTKFDYQYDASGNMTNAMSSAMRYALTYDEDNRVNSVRWSSATGTTDIVNEYDALGRRVSRSLNGGKTRYVLDLTGNMERILCDINSDSTFTYYVHGPDLCYRVEPDGKVTCFHADAMANVIAMSGANQALVAQYAYTPYGRLISSTNLQSQIPNPYRFGGGQGVMEEILNLYFMRARYYSAETGSFLSTDSVRRIGPGWNPAGYAYASMNPTRYIDPIGLFAIYVIGGNGSATAVVGAAGAEVSGSGGLIFETRALFRGDIARAIGSYETVGTGASIGIKAGFAWGAEFGVSWDGGYGVESYRGRSAFVGGSGGAGATARLDLSYEPGTFRMTGFSLSFGGGPTAGIEGHTGLSTTYVQSLRSNREKPESTTPKSGALSTSSEAVRINVSQGESPRDIVGGSVSGNSKANQSVSSRTATTAAPYGSSVTAANQTSIRPPSLSSGLTSGGAGGSSSQINLGVDAFSQMANANSTVAIIRDTNPVTSQVKEAPEKSSTGIIQQIFNWFTGLFGGSSSSGSAGAKK